MTKSQTNLKQQQKGVKANSAINNIQQTAETDLHIEQTTSMQADKEAFRQQ